LTSIGSLAQPPGEKIPFLVAVLACGSTDASASTAHRKSPGFGTAGLGQAEPGDHHRKNHKQRVGQGCGNGQEFGS